VREPITAEDDARSILARVVSHGKTYVPREKPLAVAGFKWSKTITSLAVTAEEIIEDVLACAEVGITMAHLHARDKDGNQTLCAADGNCTWHSGFGGFCEEDWTSGQTCMGISEQDACNDNATVANCTWVVDNFFQENSVGGAVGWCQNDWNYIGTWYDCPSEGGTTETTCEAAGTADSNGVRPCNWMNSTGGEGTGAAEGVWDFGKVRSFEAAVVESSTDGFVDTECKGISDDRRYTDGCERALPFCNEQPSNCPRLSLHLF